jgi:hypothetical protein
MSQRTSFYRKIAYGVAIAILLFPLSLLSSPATVTEAGGRLARLRSEHGLGQANLGEVDPASETMKLATLGLRGVAVNLLWEKANYYKKVEDWTSLTATLEQLAKLQPNFITFWRFQAWNLSYNVSVEFDDYHDRYYYVRRGIQFLKEGEQYNLHNPDLLWDLGWFIGQKIGRADERVQYRRLFKADDDFFRQLDLPAEERDNWLVSKQYYRDAIEAVDVEGKSLGRKSPRIFYERPAKSQMNYAEAIEEEGFFEKARRAWVLAADEWRQYGDIVLPHSTGVKLRLGDQARLEKVVADLQSQLDALFPGARDQLTAQKRSRLSAEDQKLLEIPPDKMTAAEQERAYLIGGSLQVTDRGVAEWIAQQRPEIGNQAQQLANTLIRERQRLNFTIQYKQDANYDYWQTRCDYEQTPEALAAHELMYRARRAFRDDADMLTAKQLYEQGFAKWRLVLDKFPRLKDPLWTTGTDLMDYIKQYREVLDQLDEPLSDSFPLWDIIEHFDADQDFRADLDAYKLHHPDEKQPTESAT